MKATVRTPLLAHGISDQPFTARHPGQVEDALNVLFGLGYGACRRPGSRFVAEITGFDSGIDVRLHAIHRDDDEKYLLVHGKNAASYLIKAYEPDGTNRTCTINSGAAAYLNQAGSASSVRMRTVGDTTFVTNRDVTPLLEATADYDVFLSWSTFDQMVSYTPLSHGSRHRTLVDTASAPKGYWQYLSQNASGSAVTFPTIQTVDNAAKDTTEAGEGGVPGDYLASGAKGGSTPAGFRVAFRRIDLATTGATWTEATSRLTATSGTPFDGLELVTDPGVVDRARTQIYLPSGTGTGFTAGWYTITSVVSSTVLELATSPSGGAGDLTNITTDGIRDEFEVVADLEFDFDSMHDIAAVLQDALQKAGAQNALIGWLELGAREGRFSLSSPYRGDQTEVYDPDAPTAAGVYDLTDNSTNSVAPFAVVRSVSSAAVGTGTQDADGRIPEPAERWFRVAAPNDPDGKIDEQTMPVVLTRDSLGPPVFSVSAAVWNNRTSGSGQTNPAPSAIGEGNAIVDTMVVGNRLVMLAGDRVVFSADGDLYRLFADTATNVVDSDPFEVVLSGDRVAIGYAMVSIRGGVTVFTEAGTQHEVVGPFTASTVDVRATTAILSSPTVPARMESRVMFISRMKDYGSAYEYYYDDSFGSYRSESVTSHVRELLPTTILQIEAATTQEIAILLPTGGGDTLYVYQSEMINRTKEQSSWTRFVIGSGSASTFSIRSVASIEDDLFVLIEAPAGGTHLLYRLPLRAEAWNPWGGGNGPGYTPHLDGMYYATGSHSAGTTTWTYPVNAPAIDTLLLEDGTVLDSTSTGWNVSGADVSVTGDYDGIGAVMGSSYEAKITLSDPIPTEDRGQSAIGDEMSIDRVTILYPKSVTKATHSLLFRADFSYPNAIDYTVDLNNQARVDGSLVGSGIGTPDTVVMTIEATGAKPMEVQSVQYDGCARERGW